MALAADVEATRLEEMVKLSAKRIIGAAPGLSICMITESSLDNDMGAHIHLTDNFNAPGLVDLQALLMRGSKMDRMVFRAMCTSHLLSITRFTVEKPGIRPLFRCGHLAEWDSGTRRLRVLAMMGKNDVGKVITAFRSGSTRSVIFTFATPVENSMSLAIPRTLSFCEWARDMRVAFAMGLCRKESLVWMLDVCLVDMILRNLTLAEEVDESDVLAILDKIDLNAL